MAIENEAKKRLLERLDPTKEALNVGFVSVILLKRNAAGTGDEPYSADGSYGGTKSITWNSTVTDTLEQSDSVIFDVEQGIRITGYQIVFDDNVSILEAGAEVVTNEYIFDEDGTFTISDIAITVG